MHEEGGHGEHEAIVSFAPIILAAGVFCINLAIGFKSLPFGVVGGLAFALGVAQWIREDMVFYGKGHG